MNNNVEVLKNNGVDVNAALGLWGDFDTYNESLKEFESSLTSKLTDLENYKKAEDWENYAILAHSIKSEAKYLGFMKESEVFLAHELNGKERNKSFIINNFVTLRETVFKIQDIIRKYLNDENSKKKLVIADDSNIILNYLEKILDKNEFEILKAKDGTEALSLLTTNLVYAILLDLNMPGSNGFEVLDYLKENNLFDRLPVVIITGEDNPETIEKTFSYPILDVLRKPFNEKNIERVLEVIKSFYENK